MTTTLMPTPKQQFFAIAGVPLVNGKLYTYAAGTTTPKPTYTDAAGLQPQKNPVELNARGEPANAIFWSGNYRIELRDALGNLIYTVDNFNTDPAGLGQLSGAAGSSMIGYVQDGAGAVPRSVQDELRDRPVNVKGYGAKGDGVTDDTAAITAADVAARTDGKALFFPAGIYMARQLTIKSGCRWLGEGRDKTIFRQIIGANTDFLIGDGAAAAWGTTAPAIYVDGWGLECLTVDGNWNNGAGNTAGAGVAVWGSRPILRDVFIINCAEHGLRTEWSDEGPLRFGMEGHFSNVRIDTVGKHGWWNNGPHDSTVVDMIVIDASQATENTYDGFLMDVKSNIRGFGLHAWNRTAAKRHRFAINDQGGSNDIIGSHFEGAYSANVNAAGTLSSYEGCNMYAAWNGVNVLIRNTGVTIRSKLGPPGAGRPACKGIVLGLAGDNASSCLIDVVAFTQNAGVIDFTNEPGLGYNSVRVRGYNDTGTVAYVGAPSAQDNSDINILVGSVPAIFRQASGTLFQRADMRFVAGGAALVETISNGVTAAGATQATATALPPNTIQPVYTIPAGSGVVLPPVATFLSGKSMMVCNLAGNALLVYPEPGAQLGTLAVNTPITVAAGKKAHFTRIIDTQWAYSLSA